MHIYRTRARARGLALVLAVLLTGCGAQQQAADVVGAARQACVTVAPILAAVRPVADPRVVSILSFADAVCGPLMAGQVPPTVDANTPQWLGQLAGMLKVLAPIALALF